MSKDNEIKALEKAIEEMSGTEKEVEEKMDSLSSKIKE